jgi:hypothetical protein
MLCTCDPGFKVVYPERNYFRPGMLLGESIGRFREAHFLTRKISDSRNKASPPRDIGYARFAFELSRS